MKNRVLLVAACCMIAVLLIGCRPRTTEPIPIHEGLEGLTMEFLDRSPPDEVYVGDRFPVTIEVHNQGAYDIKDGLFVYGVESDYIIEPYEPGKGVFEFSLRGKSDFNPFGDLNRDTKYFTAKSLDPQSQTHTTTTSVTACYPYKTEATAQVCIDTDVLGQRIADKVCTPHTISMGAKNELPKGQGSPIAITKVEPKMLTHPENENLVRPQFFIYVANMGEGIPMEFHSYETACSSTAVERNKWNVAGIRAYLSDRSIELDCKPKIDEGSVDKEGFLKFEEKEDFIKCTLEEGIPNTAGTYNTPLIIDMTYGYTFTISKQVLIKRSI